MIQTLRKPRDAEPSLGWSIAGSFGGTDDVEQQDGDDEDGADDEPSLGSTEDVYDHLTFYSHNTGKAMVDCEQDARR